MRYRSFIGPSYVSQAATADQEETINLYEEKMESPGATTERTLYPIPGFELLVDTNSTDGRAHVFSGGREFSVIGSSLIEFDSDAVPTFRGTVAMDSNPATISYNGPGGGQLLITSGTNAYLFTLATNAFAAIPAIAGKATMGDQLDGYFLVLDAATGTMYASELLDGATWNTSTMFAQRNAAPDPWVSLKVLGKLIYLWGNQTGEVWFDNGAVPFPFAPHPSGLFSYGTAAAFSAVVCDNSLLWLGATKAGHGFVCRIEGFSPEVVSSYPVQFAINSYSTVSDAYGDSYNDAGHTFYTLSFPTANVTWAFDLQMSAWAKRGSWDTLGTPAFSVWRPRCHALAFGEHRWLHATGTGLYRMALDIPLHDVDGLPIRRVRRAPAIQNENERIRYSSFELDLDRGLGLVTGQGSDPQVMMRFSNDGGKTWSSERMCSAGKMGEYNKRVMWDRLGQARRRVYEVVMTDPTPWRLTNAYLGLPDAQRGAA